MECKRHQKIKEKWSCCNCLDDYEIMSNEEKYPKISSTMVSVAEYECHQRSIHSWQTTQQ
jgi:hypothetical protein